MQCAPASMCSIRRRRIVAGRERELEPLLRDLKKS
jgi:hypothetical protein